MVADDLDPAGQYRDGQPSEPVTVGDTNIPPNQPPQLTATSTDGATTLTWTAASPEDPDGDSVAFYRIFFASLLLHELGHALQARREGVEI